MKMDDYEFNTPESDVSDWKVVDIPINKVQE